MDKERCYFLLKLTRSVTIQLSIKNVYFGGDSQPLQNSSWEMTTIVDPLLAGLMTMSILEHKDDNAHHSLLSRLLLRRFHRVPSNDLMVLSLMALMYASKTVSLLCGGVHDNLFLKGLISPLK